MLYTVNADMHRNVMTAVDTEDPPIPNTEEAVKQQALRQLFCGNYAEGAMLREPEINWVEVDNE